MEGEDPLKPLCLKEIEEATGGILIHGDPKSCVDSVEIDSRRLVPGSLFVAIKGERQDGHQYVREAAEKGSVAALVQNHCQEWPIGGAIRVEDTVDALQRLAVYYLNQFPMKKVGITGSTGKTTTKDMVDAVCATKYRTAKTPGNFNNHIGLPLSILGMKEETQLGIFEMGMDHPGEIAFLSNMVKPDVGIITNVGYSHMEKLGSQENILRAKLEIVEGIGPNGVLIINEDSDLLARDNASGDYRLVTVGTKGMKEYLIHNISDYDEEGLRFDVERGGETVAVQLPVPGRHNALNATLALACGVELGIPMAQGVMGLRRLELTEKRLKLSFHKGMKIIDDTYNASPDSVRGALDVLISRKGLRKIAVLGDMYELGEDSIQHHLELGRYAGSIGVDMVVTVGELAYNINLGAKDYLKPENNLHFSRKEELISQTSHLFLPGDVILLKGSRGTKMEEILQHMMKD
jgi:UDP-N-acetylmuramoyl-tripeptide--D-alanyl-D-alanine ligase